MWRARFWRRTAQDSCALGAAGAWASGSLLPLQSAVPLRGKSQSARFSEICNTTTKLCKEASYKQEPEDPLASAKRLLDLSLIHISEPTRPY